MYVKQLLPYLYLVLLSGCIEPVTQLEEKRLFEAQQEMAFFHVGLDPEVPLELSIQDAIDMALDRNLELLVNAQQVEIQRGTFSRQALTMLPILTATGNWSYRSKNTGAFSQSLVPNIPPAPPSFSSEQTINTWDITCTWKLIDFCMAYFRSTQESNKTLALSYEYHRASQNLILQVVQLYWKLAAETKNMEKAEKLSCMGNVLKGKVEKVIKAGALGLETGSRVLSQLATFQIQIEDNLKQFHRTLAEFKQIVGLPPDILVVLTDAIPKQATIELPCVKDLEEMALLNRPELFSKDIQDLVWSDEVHIALVQLFPETAPFISSTYDGNRFLIFNHWMMNGINVAWNLLAIPVRWEEAKLARKQKCLNHYNRLMIAMGVLSQVHLSYALCYDDFTRMQKIQDLWLARKTLLRIAREKRRAQALGDYDYYLAYFDAYLAEAELRRALADVQGSIEQINNSIGQPLYFGHDEENT